MTEKEKIEQVRQYSGMTWKALAKRLNLKSAQTFTDIRRGKHGISKTVAAQIVANFPEISIDWLLLDKGQMLEETAGEVFTLHENPICMLDDCVCGKSVSTALTLKQIFPNASDVLRNTTDAMSEYPNGSFLMLREVANKNLLVPGCDYLFITEAFSMVRRLQKGEAPGQIALYATNNITHPDGRCVYEPMEISVADLKKVYAVVGCVFGIDGEAPQI